MKKTLLTGVSAVAIMLAVPVGANASFFQWVEGNFEAKSGETTFGVSAFKPLSETKNSLLYTQISTSRVTGKNTFNLGVGMRRLASLGATPAIIGANVFFDAKDGNKKFWSLSSSDVHQRTSIGLELKTATLDVSANYYMPLSKNIINDEKVMKGWDATVKGSIPNMQSVAVGLNTYKFTGTSGNYEQGNKAFVAFKPNQMITLKASYDKPKGEKAKTKVMASFKFIMGHTAKVEDAPNVWSKRYDKVERRYDVLTEKVVKVAIGGTPTTTTAEWIQAITPDYKLPTEVVKGKVKESFATTDYTFVVKQATAGIFTAGDKNADVNFDKATGEVKGGRTVKAGEIVVTVTRKAKGLLAKQSKDVTLTVTKKVQPFAVATAYQTQGGANSLNAASGARIKFDIDDQTVAAILSRKEGNGTVTVSDLIAPATGTIATYDTDFEVYNAATGGTKYADWDAVKAAIAAGTAVYFEDDTSNQADIIRFTITIGAGADDKFEASSEEVFMKANAATT